MNDNKIITHDILVKAAGKWLMKFGCGIVFEEFKSCNREIPDAIGWKDGYSILIEAKISRSDFLTDFKKPHRIDPEKGMGNYRLFICEKDLIEPEELPVGWGLLYINIKTGKVRKKKCWKGNTVYKVEDYGIIKFNANLEAERRMLISRIRRTMLGYGEL